MSIIDLEDVGVIYGDMSDQAPLVQKALDTADTAVRVGGIVPRLDELLTNHRNIPIFGHGSADDWNISPSALVWSPAADRPGYAIEHAKHATPYRVEGVTLTGPGWGSPVPAGQFPSQLRGVLCPTRGQVVDVRIYGFGSGVDSLNDHQFYDRYDFRGNGYAIDIVDNPDGGLGDMEFHHGYMTDCSRASIGLSSSGTLANARFVGNGHMGVAPFAIHRYKGASPARNTALEGVTFENWSIEATGHAAFYDEAGGGSWNDIKFDGNGVASPFGGPQWDGMPTDLAIFDLGPTSYATVWQFRMLPVAVGHPTISAGAGVFDISADVFSPTGFQDFGWRPFHNPLPYNEWGNEISGVTLGRQASNCGGMVASASVAQEDLTRGDALELVAYGHVARNRSGKAIGFACDDFKQGEVAVYGTQFDTPFMPVRNPGSTAIPQGALVMIDPAHVGGVKKATSRSVAIGRVSDAAIPARGAGRAQIQL